MGPGQIDSSSVNVSGTGVEHEKASIMQAYFRIAKPEDYLGQSKNDNYMSRVFSLPSFNPSTNNSTASRTSGMYQVLNSTGSTPYLATDTTFRGYDKGATPLYRGD